jgi:small-conductance mechanosensitive channel
LYIVVKRPYGVGDRIAIEEMRGDDVSIDFFVTELWGIDGDLVSSNQPSERIVTVPNSTVLSSRVVNF